VHSARAASDKEGLIAKSGGMSIGLRDHGIQDLDWLTTTLTIINYVLSDIKKKQ